MSSQIEIINHILWNYLDIPDDEFASLVNKIPLKIVRWLVTHHPDNRIRKRLLRQSNVFCGRGSVINMGFIVSDDYKPLLTIGERVAISPNVVIICSSSPNNSRLSEMKGFKERYMKELPVSIGNDTWIGAGSIILPGVNIGSQVIVGAGTVVTKDIPDYAVVVGDSFKIISSLKQ